MSDSDQEQKRVRKLTEKAEEVYITQVDKYRTDLISCRRDIEQIIIKFENSDLSRDVIKNLKSDLNYCYEFYESVFEKCQDYLSSTRTEDSLKEQESQEVIHRTTSETVVSTLNKMERLIKNLSPSSAKSVHSSHSSKSSHSSVASQKARAVAAKARLEFERKEAELIKQKARLVEEQSNMQALTERKKTELDADIRVLEKEKDVVVAEVELKAYEEEFESVKSTVNLKLDLDRTVITTMEPQVDLDQTAIPVVNARVDMVKPSVSHSVKPEIETDKLDIKPSVVHKVDSVKLSVEPSVVPKWDPADYVENLQQTAVMKNSAMSRCTSGLDPGAEPFRPLSSDKQYSDISKYLLRRDLLTERFYKFDDKSENFGMWKTSFRTILKDLEASPAEEFDLLMKYLGPESKTYAISVRQASSNNLEHGLTILWERLHERYGSPELVESAFKQRLDRFPRLTGKDNKKLYELSDLCNEVNAVKQDPQYSTLLSYFDSSTGVRPIVNKLPVHLQNRWMTRASTYKRVNQVHFPPFGEFCAFLREMSSMLNDPGLSVTYSMYEKQDRQGVIEKPRPRVSVRKTEVFKCNTCPFHANTDTHTLNECKTFKKKSVSERKKFLKDHNICYKCCNAVDHNFKSCTFTGRCSECDSDRHPSALHYFQSVSPKDHGRERPSTNNQRPPTFGTDQQVRSSCTKVCGKGFSGKSCSKTVLAKVYPNGQPARARTVYCILDDQSNRTLCRPELFDILCTDSESVGEECYTLVSCSGSFQTSGRTLSGLTVSALDDSFSISLPRVLECVQIPDTHSEIPTPEVTQYHDHLSDIPIPPLRSDVDIVLLIGRDVPDAHHVYEQRLGRPNAPFAQRLGLGWVVVGEVCLDAHKSNVNVMKTYIHSDGRPSLFQPCESKIAVKTTDNDIFIETANDNKQGLSIEDKEFVKMMDLEFCQDETGHWSAPLPFRTLRVRLPNNKAEAYRRAKSLDASLRRNPTKQKHCMEFMRGILDKGHAELAPSLQDEEECWYLPLFGVYHPKKKDKIRIVFDSSSKHDGVSLNSVLMSGPDLTNSLAGILMRFRKEKVAVTGDIEQMFYQFRVHNHHRNYLRFLWYRDNDFSKPLTEYRMCVHVFGNSPSPAVATYGLRRIAQNAAEVHGDAVFNFVKNDFYVDDGLTSLSSEDDAVALLTNTQRALEEEGRLRFHKLVSNNPKVLEHFKEEDLAKALKTEDSPTERSLGLSWNLTEDCFVFQYTLDKKSCYTKRNVLSTINSLYDPLGFLSPFTICGKILLRDITSKVNDWDEPIPEPLQKKWLSWFESLQDLQTLRIPRTYFPQHVRFNPESELHVFCDASEKAIASVAFLKTVTEDGNIHVGYAFGKAKVAPKHGHTIPRLELCAAVLAVEITEAVSEELSISPSKITYYTDSKVVLGYLNNRTRRFYIYVENRVSRILRFSKPSQWLYIETSNNPADEGTRGMKPSDLKQCIWLSGEPLLTISNDISANYQLQNPDDDVEVRPIVKSMKTDIRLGVSRFEKFSSWKRLILAVAVLIRFIRRFRKEASTADESSNGEESKSRAKECIIKQIQQESFSREIGCLTNKKTLLKDSHVVKLSPFLDERGILRVGGRLRKSQLAAREKNPILIPGRSHVALLIVRFYHEEIHHQGRHVTEGAVRSAGFWITGGKRMIAKLIQACVPCRKLRGKVTYQKMADLPVDRLTPAPPFTFVGVDVFGPWSIVTRRTRGGSSSSKRWAVLFTCLAVRAVHIEVIDEMSSSAFINAVRRLLAIRGKVKVFRSDRGTNFVGATDDLSIDAINVEDRNVKNFLDDTGTTWLFNPPHASHFGWVWERMIGVTRRILDAILLENKHKHLTHDVLCTFMAEVCAIVNARPIVPVSTDPDDPFILSPSVLLTQKTADSSVDTYQDLGVKDMYKAQWKCVQVLAETFWKKWRRDYLSGLQSRQVWQDQSEDIKEGDLVLLRDKSVVRNEWPVGLVETVYASDDGLVRKVAVKVIKDNKPTAYIRPIVELVKLLE